MDSLESSFLSEMRGLNQKRLDMLVKRATRLIPELLKASEGNSKGELENVLKSLQMPSSKEYKKKLHKLCLESVTLGILRADKELSRLRELYTFSESGIDVKQGNYYFQANIPEGAQEWIRNYAYSIGVITEETVIESIREALQKGLEQGLGADQLKKLIQDKAGIYLSDRHAETIARVETAKMYNTGRLARYTHPDNDGFIVALQYDAIVDTRTTELCKHLDGRYVHIDDQDTINKYSPPNHFNCRATWLPVSKYEDFTIDFDPNEEPQKGFGGTATKQTLTNKLTEEKNAPLVVVKEDIKVTHIKDPELLRKLSDEEFKNNIGNVKDPQVKLSLVLERAEQMVKEETRLLELGSDGYFKLEKPQIFGVKGVAGKEYKWLVNGIEYQGYATDAMIPEITTLMRTLQGKGFMKPDEAEKLINEFIATHSHAKYLTINNALRDSLKGSTSFVWKGLKTHEISDKLLKEFTVDKPARLGQYNEDSPLWQNVPKAEKWLMEHLDDKTATGKPIKLVLERSMRAFAMLRTNSIHFNPTRGETRTVIHEIGHLIHDNNPEITQLIDRFYKNRTEGDKKTKLYGEETYRDHFFDPYVGRIYGFEEPDGLGSEVFSMGLEYMYADPEKLYKKDKEHFMLIYAIMRGLF